MIERMQKGATMPEQLSLHTEYVDLTQEERADRGRTLADALRHVDQMADDHKERKLKMRKEREQLLAHVAGLAEIVRSGREERPVATARG